MNKFQKLSQLNKDIELLENAGKIKAAEVLHNKFIKEAQYAMPQVMTTMMPQLVMPQVAPMMPQMFARPTMPVVQTAVPRTVATPTPVQQGQVTPPVTGTTPPTNPPTNPPTAPPTNKEIRPPYVTPPPAPPPTQYGDPSQKNNELQFLQNELQRLQREYGMDCGPFAAQCNTIKQMIDKNKGGAIIKG